MKILFVHNHPATFTRIDQEILSSQHVVRELYVRHATLWQLFLATVAAIRGVFWCDLVFAWFGAFHALLPFLVAKWLNKPCIVVSSGYDVANESEINYGNMRPGPRRWIGRWVFRLADQVLPVSQFAGREAIANAGVNPQKVRVIPHGVALAEKAIPIDSALRQRFILTVSGINKLTLERKGVLHFTRLATLFPDCIFWIIGPYQEDEAIRRLREIAPPNVLIPGPMNYDDLRRFMQTVSVYVQLSYYESFCMSLAEAMLAGCVPVVVNRGALPEVVGDAGYVVPYGDLPQIAEAIRSALSADVQARQRASQRIATVFPLEERARLLLKTLEEIGK
ncbi:glycosyltransferase family 4 protein [Caldilinea sp.]|uniref:glycosyltransferase family 4 protein n=1 Tax=Caldilinea sp. TaxID=2293560 RepID=UPI0026056551|nr:glycosyltransferase family 4 protein [uncultured Caldilinea sp.]